MPDEAFGALLHPSTNNHPYDEMKDSTNSRPKPTMNKITIIQALSYVLDWAILVVVGVVGLILGKVTPNKRPFSLLDPNISYVLLQVATTDSQTLKLTNSVLSVVASPSPNMRRSTLCGF